MLLKELNINRGWNDKDPLSGKIKVSGASGVIEIRLTEDHAAKIVAICATALVEVAQETSKLMTADLIEQSVAAALPDPEAA